MAVVCRSCHIRKVALRSGVLVCVGCDFGPTGMAGLPVAERVKDGPK